MDEEQQKIIEDERYKHQHRDCIEWVGECSRHMATIRVGMTREELLQVFTPADGISTAQGGIFVYRRCPFFKVSVTFNSLRGEPDEQGRVFHHPEDVIETISRPIVSTLLREYF